MGFGDGAGAWGQGGVACGGTVEGWGGFMGGDVTGVISQNAVWGEFPSGRLHAAGPDKRYGVREDQRVGSPQFTAGHHTAKWVRK